MDVCRTNPQCFFQRKYLGTNEFCYDGVCEKNHSQNQKQVFFFTLSSLFNHKNCKSNRIESSQLDNRPIVDIPIGMARFLVGFLFGST